MGSTKVVRTLPTFPSQRNVVVTLRLWGKTFFYVTVHECSKTLQNKLWPVSLNHNLHMSLLFQLSCK